MKAETNAQRDYDYWLWENYYTLKQIKNFNNLLKKNCKIVEPRSAHAVSYVATSLSITMQSTTSLFESIFAK